jgi:hypothetical protein
MAPGRALKRSISPGRPACRSRLSRSRASIERAQTAASSLDSSVRRGSRHYDPLLVHSACLASLNPHASFDNVSRSAVAWHSPPPPIGQLRGQRSVPKPQRVRRRTLRRAEPLREPSLRTNPERDRAVAAEGGHAFTSLRGRFASAACRARSGRASIRICWSLNAGRVCVPVGLQHDAPLGSDLDFVATAGNRAGYEALVMAGAVGAGGAEEGCPARSHATASPGPRRIAIGLVAVPGRSSTTPPG